MSLLILTGPPGCGKTTCAAALAAGWSGPAVHVPADCFWGWIGSGAIAPHLPESQAQNQTVIDVLVRVVEGYVAGGYSVVLDGIVGPWFLQPFLRLPCPVHYIILWQPLQESLERVCARDQVPDSEATRVMHAAFATEHPHRLDVSGCSPGQVLALVRAAWQNGTFRLH